MRTMSAALACAHLPGITPRRLAAWRSSGLAFEDLLASRGGGLWSAADIRGAQDRAAREVEHAAANDIKILALDDPGYPDLLARLPDPPLALRVRGNSQRLLDGLRSVAVVGARRADAYGRSCAELFARELARAGLTVTSGLAYGVDAAAHRAALGEPGGTIAVFGTGVDVIYPRDHAGLAAEILAHGGALLSEHPAGTGPQKGHFPLRNRIIAGVSLGTLVIQAGAQSGSLITARLAVDYDRLVWAVPGRLGDALSTGTLELIREGATIALSPGNILDDLAPLGATPATTGAHAATTVKPPVPGDPILAAIGSDGATVDDLAATLARSRSELLAELLKRELAKQVTADPGGIYRLTFR